MRIVNYKQIGLKYAWSKTKSESLRFRIKELCYELRYAWERLWRGYDSIDVIEFSDNFQARQIAILERMKETMMGMFSVPYQSPYYHELGENDEWEERRFFTEEQTNIILDMMIFHLKMMNEDVVKEEVKKSHKNVELHPGELYRLVNRIQLQNKDRFMELFSMFYYQLWT